MKTMSYRTARLCALAFTFLLIAPAAAQAHARVSPAVALTGKLQLFSLAVPTEKSGLTTTRIAMTVPQGFGIDSFVPPPAGWRMSEKSRGTSGGGVVETVTWSGGRTPTGEDSLFQFLAQPADSQTYTFQVQQTYSDGSIVNWSGPESSAAPAPTIQAVASVDGGGTSTLTIVALILAVLGLAAGLFALAGGRGDGRRPLA